MLTRFLAAPAMDRTMDRPTEYGTEYGTTWHETRKKALVIPGQRRYHAVRIKPKILPDLKFRRT